jgi:hypothetical protein
VTLLSRTSGVWPMSSVTSFAIFIVCPFPVGVMACGCGLTFFREIYNSWRKRVGVEPTGDRKTCRPPVLKTGMITGPHALPE